MSELNFDRAFFGDDFIPEWEMTDFERVVFVGLLERLQPNYALEVGSRNGGSLQVLTRTCKNVISLDIDQAVQIKLQSKFPTVTFITGDSKILLPRLLVELQEQNELPDFIFIDGDHTINGAASDIHNALSIKPVFRTWVLVHDTFNPDVRAGMMSLQFENYKNLHYAALDFAPGILLSSGILKGQIWGGFSLFILEPNERIGKLVCTQQWQNLWELANKHESGI